MKIENIPISEIVPYEKNPRKNDKAVDIVAKSIKEFGFKNPIILDKKNEIIAGHTRLKAAIKLKLKEVPVIRADDLTPEQVKAFRIMDNKSSEFAEWDLDLLKEEFYELEDTSAFEFTGFTDQEISKIWDKETEEDDFETPKQAKYDIKEGEIWELGNHRLMCGDSTKKEHVDALMGENKADMVFTDPPYGIDLNVDFLKIHPKNKLGHKGKQHLSFKKIIGDKQKYNPKHIFEMFGYCKEIFLWGADYYLENIPLNGGWFVWDKVEGRFEGRIGNEFELCWSKIRHKKEIIYNLWVGHKGLEKEDTKSRIHPTQKPIKLFKWFLLKFSKDENIIADLFGGSGSTLIACEQLKRKCFMMEIDSFYCSVIIERWEKLTGNKGVKIEQIEQK